MRIVLADAGRLIAPGKLNRLPLLAQLYGAIHAPRAVYQETVIAGSVQDAPDSANIRLFLEHHKFPILDVSESLLQSHDPAPVLGMGERYVLTLAQSLTGAEVLVLLDDEMARVEARRLGLQVKVPWVSSWKHSGRGSFHSRRRSSFYWRSPQGLTFGSRRSSAIRSSSSSSRLTEEPHLLQLFYI